MRLATVGFLILAVCAVASAPSLADTYPRQSAIDVLEYVFRLELGDDDLIRGLATVDFRRTGAADTLALDLVGPGGDTGMTVSGAWATGARRAGTTGGDAPLAIATRAVVPESLRGIAATYRHEDDRVVVSLPAELAGQDRVLVTVAYSGTPATGLRIGPNRHGDRTFFSDNWPNRARHWLPTIDHPYDKARSQMVVTAPARFQVISNGLLVEETDLGDGRRLTHWRQSVPIATWLYVLGAAEFAVEHLEPFEGKPVQSWVYPQDRDAGFAVFADPTHAALRYYDRYVGPFAYEKLANVQSASVGGGMEAATAIFYGEDSYTGGVRWRNVIVHEIAHQWFGNTVTESDWDDVWLSEGFATYFTSLFVEHAYGRDEFEGQMRSARDRVLAFYADRPDYRIVHDNLDDMSQVTTGMQYQKGSWVLHMLRVLVGEDIFWDGIRTYYARHFNGNASTADFQRAMEEASGRELGWFFDQWLQRGGVPEVEVAVAGDGATPRIVLRQVQDGEPFRLLVPLRAVLTDGTVVDGAVDMTGGEAFWTPNLPAELATVELDPRVELLWRPLDGDR